MRHVSYILAALAFTVVLGLFVLALAPSALAQSSDADDALALYDENDNGIIDADEAIAAVLDYLNDRISRDLAVRVMRMYLDAHPTGQSEQSGDFPCALYDQDCDGQTAKYEVINAINDYLFGDPPPIRKDHVISIINCYLFDEDDDPDFLPVAPPVPKDLTGRVGPGVGQISLDWDSVDRANGYKVQQKYRQSWNTLTATSTPHRVAIDVSQSNAVVSGLTNGISYEHRVSAVCSHGGGSESSEWSTSITTPPPPVPTPTVSISAVTTSVTEGQSITFTLTASSAPVSNLTVKVSVTQSGSFIRGTPTTSVTISSGQTSASFKVNTHNDSVDEPDGSITATLSAGTGYGLGSTSSKIVTVLDNDLPPKPTPTVSISAVTTSVTEGQSVTFTPTSSFAPNSNLPVNVGVTQIGSFIRGTATTSVSMPSGQTSASFSVDTDDDSVDEPSGSITASVEAGTGYGVGSSSSVTATVLDNDLPKLASPDILGVEPLPLRRAKLTWRGVPKADRYSVEAQDPSTSLSWATIGTPTCAIPPAQTAEICTIGIRLDSVINSRGFGHADAFEFKVKAISNSGTILPGYSDIITIIDNPILTGGRVSGYNVGTEGRAALQWGRIPEATQYIVEYRKLGRRPSYEGVEGLPHTEENWPGALSWPYYEDLPASPLEFGAGASDPVGRPVTGLELGELYAIQVNYRTSTSTTYSARDAYVWPSSDYPENGKRVGTYTFFGHHASKEFEYIICKDTFPDDPTTSGVNETDQWVELIKHAFGQWITSTDQFITMTPRVHGVDGWRCSDTSLPISRFIMEDDERNEVRMFDVEGGLPATGIDPNWSFSEIKSDAFKICVTAAPACVTSFTGYAGIDFPDAQRQMIADIVASWRPLWLEKGLVVDILNRYGSQSDRQASTTIVSVDVNFRRQDPADSMPQFTPNMPDQVEFNTCVTNGIPDPDDDSRSDPPFAYATAVHEAGHPLGLSNVNYPIFGNVPDDAAHPTIPDAAMNYDSRAESAFPGWGILNPGHVEPDCSPHPFDLMAVYALYGRVP